MTGSTGTVVVAGASGLVGTACVCDTEESFVHWLRVLQERRVLPSPS